MQLQRETYTFGARTSGGVGKLTLIASAVSFSLLLIGSKANANIRPVNTGQITGLPVGVEDLGPTVNTGGPLEIGINGPAGIFIDLAPTPNTFIEGPFTLLSTTSTLAVNPGSIGRVAMTQATWDIAGDLTVGQLGVAELELDLSSFVEVSGTTVVGDFLGSSGLVDVMTVLSRLRTDELVVGDAGQGQIAVSTTGLLNSNITILGNQLTGRGAVRLNDDSNWTLNDQLVVGQEGIGEFTLNQFSSIVSTFTDPNSTPPADPNQAAIIGNDVTGRGYVTLNDSSYWYVGGEITVGNLGWGTVDLNGASTMVSYSASIGRGDGSTGHVTLNGSSRWEVQGHLGVGLEGGGDPNSSGLGTLSINDTASVQVDSLSALIVARRGEINMGGGTLKYLPSVITPQAIENWGIIRGKGTIDALLNINSSGELRNAADIANQREMLLMTLAVNVSGNMNGSYETTDGLIESQGGEMEFQGLVTNNGTIVLNEAIMRFRGSEFNPALTSDLVNDGVVYMGPGSTLYGNISSSTGNIIIDLTTGAGLLPANIFGDLRFVPPIVAAITEEEGELAAIQSSPDTGLSFIIDENPGVLSILGDLELNAGSTILSLDPSSTFTSQPGDSFTLVSASNIVGDFFNSQLSFDGYLWDIIVDYVTDEVRITNTGNLYTGILGDFNGDGRVDALDFLLWQRNPGVGDLADWYANYGSPTSPNATAVPEPSTLVMALGLFTLRFRRRRR